jgi:hypothetical protein
MAKKMLPKMVAFRNQRFHSFPNSFLEYDDFKDTMSLEEYSKGVASGIFVGGGLEAWLKTLDEIIYAFRWAIYGDYPMCDHDKKEKEFYLHYFGEYPYEEKEENLSITYWYKKKGEELTCYASTSDTEYKRSDGYRLVYKDKDYSNDKLITAARERAYRGFELLGKHFCDLSD